ncbi:hypothetical protein CsatB_011440 [Cannabis sativa]
MKLLTAVVFAITLMLSLWLCIMAQARVTPSSSYSSLKLTLNFNSQRLMATKSKQPAIAASFRTIPPSIPNPTQNKLKPRKMG